ncbi:MAG: LuxR family transcriptional regulator, partial [Actinobacteria bacterium]|nr:LuxR family transcriptional regulator [Actinomycetota bacterium]
MKSGDVMRALASDEQAYEKEPLSSLLFPLRFLGMGLLVSWLCCTHVVSIFPGVGFDPSFRNTFDIGMRFGDIGTFIVLALMAKRLGRLSQHLGAGAASVALTALGTAVIGLYIIPIGASLPIIYVTSALTAIGGAVLFCLWAEAYCQMGATQMLMYGASSCVFAALVAFVIGIMTAPFAIIATSLLPLASFICVVLSFRLVPAERQPSSDMHYPLPGKLIGIMAVAGLLSGLAGSLLTSPEGVGAIHRVAATGLAGITIIITALVRTDRTDVRFLAKVSLPLFLAAFALVPFAGPIWGYVVSFLIKLAYVWFTIFILLMLANLVYRFEIPSLRLFAIARASSEAALFAGVITRRALQQTALLSDLRFLMGITLCGIALVLICAFIWTREKSVNGDWGASGISLENKLRVPGSRERFMMRCDELASHYGLTAREAEIMALISQHKSR